MDEPKLPQPSEDDALDVIYPESEDDRLVLVSLEEQRADNLALIIATTTVSVGSLLCIVLPFVAAMHNVQFVITHEILVAFLPPLGWILWHHYKRPKGDDDE